MSISSLYNRNDVAHTQSYKPSWAAKEEISSTFGNLLDKTTISNEGKDAFARFQSQNQTTGIGQSSSEAGKIGINNLKESGNSLQFGVAGHQEVTKMGDAQPGESTQLAENTKEYTDTDSDFKKTIQKYQDQHFGADELQEALEELKEKRAAAEAKHEDAIKKGDANAIKSAEGVISTLTAKIEALQKTMAEKKTDIMEELEKADSKQAKQQEKQFISGNPLSIYSNDKQNTIQNDIEKEFKQWYEKQSASSAGSQKSANDYS